LDVLASRAKKDKEDEKIEKKESEVNQEIVDQ